MYKGGHCLISSFNCPQSDQLAPPRPVQKHTPTFLGHIIRQEGIQGDILEGMVEEEAGGHQEPHGQTASRDGRGTGSTKI